MSVIGSIGSSYQAEFGKLDAERNEKKARAASASDKPSFSQKALELASTKTASLDTIKAQIADAPDVRNEKLDGVRQKISSGYYNDSKVIDQIAESLTRTIL